MEPQRKLICTAKARQTIIFILGMLLLSLQCVLPLLATSYPFIIHHLPFIIFMPIRNVFSALILLFAVQLLFAQRGQVVLETQRSMSFGTRPCFRLEFDNAETGLVEDSWKKFAKDRFGAKLKKDKKSGEWTASKVNSPVFGETVTLYSTVEKMQRGAALNVWADYGSYFLNRRDNAGNTEEVARSLRECYYDIRRSVIGQELKVEEDKLKDLEKKQKTLTKDNESLRKDIEDWKMKIRKAEEQIANNEKMQESNLVDQDGQRRLIEEIKRRLENVENEGN